MSKKKLILIPALLMALTACGPSTSAPTSEPTTEPTVSTPTTETAPTVEVTATKIEITNKDELSAKWFVGDADRNVNYTITYSDGSTKARGATVESSNPEVVGCPGGVKIHANGKGTATITVTIDSLTDSVEVSVDELAKEETVTVAELLNKPVNDATAYIVTGYIVSWQSGKTDATAYGNFIIADKVDDTAEAGILVYGATLHEDSLKYDETLKTWSWSNPNSDKENPRPFPFADYKIGDKVTMKGLRLDYNTTKEFNGIITEHVPVQKDPVTEVTFKTKTTSIGNGYSFTFKALDNNEDEDVVYTLEGDAATLKGATVTADATKTGTVTLTATHKSNAELKASVEINIVANPEIVDATLEEVINDEGTKGNKLFRVTAKTVANASTKDDDQYGNFDYTDGTNTIASYGLSANASTISYYGDVWNFKNDKSFQNTGIEIGSDNEYTVIVMRSDYKGTKQLVGYVYSEPTEDEPADEYMSIAECLAAADGTEIVVKGTVDNIGTPYSEQYGNISLTITDGKDSLYCYRLKGNFNVGDVIVVTGVMATYNEARQVAAGATAVLYTEEPADEYMSIAECLAAADDTEIEVKGIVKTIGTAYSEQYGNISLTITDGKDSLYCYRLKGNFNVGDEIVVTGKMATYNEARQVAAGATAVVLSTGNKVPGSSDLVLPENATKVTAAYKTETTTNMTGGNDAALLGLDSNWTVTGNKNGNNNFPGLNKAGEIRLYGNPGNTIDFSYSAGTIHSIKINFVAGEDLCEVSVANTAVTGEGGVFAINNTAFTLTNIVEGATTQVKIASIEIVIIPNA